MKFIDNTLYIEFKELVSVGISGAAIRKAKNRNSSSWSFLQDPDDHRKVLIEYEKLKSKYKKLVIDKLCGGLKPNEYFSTQAINRHLVIKQGDMEFIQSETGLRKDTRAKAVEACKYLYLLERLNTATLKKKAFPKWTVDEFWDNLIAHIKANKTLNKGGKAGINLSSNRIRLTNFAKKYSQDGPSVLISRRMNNKNSSKLGKTIENGKLSVYSKDLFTQQMSLLLELRANLNNFDYVQITKKYNLVARDLRYPELTSRQVESILFTGEHNRITSPGRYGAAYYYNTQSIQAKRRRPVMPLQYVTVDGWEVELFYQERVYDSRGNSKMLYDRRLKVVIILDTFNNYPLGYAIDDQESAILIKQAMKNAVDHVHKLTGRYYIPYQIQSDHFAYSEMKSFYEMMSHVFTPARVGNAKSKVIEPYFRHINKTYCQMLYNWSGFGITSRRENQPNRSLKDKIKKSFPDRPGVIRQIEKIITSERQERIDNYMPALEKANKMTLTDENYLRYLGIQHSRTAKLTGRGFMITIGGVKMTYDSFDRDFRNQDHRSWQAYYDLMNLSKILVEADDGKYRFILDEKYEQPMALNEQTAEDRRELKKIKDYNKADEQAIAEARAENIRILEDMFYDHPELEDIRKLTMFTQDGQQKKLLQEAKGIKALKPPKRKIKEEEEESIEEKHMKYLDRKNIDMTKYL